MKGPKGKGRNGRLNGRPRKKAVVGAKTASKVPVPDVTRIHVAKPKLLSDAQVQRFIRRGYLVLETREELSPSFHQGVFETARAMEPTIKSNPGNNILPVLPEVSLVYDCPTVRGALQSLLGEHYYMHPHRHIHETTPGKASQKFHKDSYWGNTQRRHHFPHWVMAMYYPQTTTVKMGPTGVLPCSQYFAMPEDKVKRVNRIPVGWGVKGKPVVVEAGSVVIIHYDIWHRAEENTSEHLFRYMFKFQFVRTVEPRVPSWNFESSKWMDLKDVGVYDPCELALENKMKPTWQAVWRWICGSNKTEPETEKRDSKAKKLGDEEDEGSEATAILCSKLMNGTCADTEPDKLEAAYRLAARGEVQRLVEMVANKKSRTTQRNAQYGLCAAGIGAVKPLLQLLKGTKHTETCEAAMFVIGELGTSIAETEHYGALENIITKHLVDGVRTKNTGGAAVVARAAAETLGLLLPTPKSIESLCHALEGSPDAQVRFESCLSLLQLATKRSQRRGDDSEDVSDLIVPFKKATTTLGRALFDEDRYVRGYAAEALIRIGSAESKRVAINALRTSRWCPITTEKSQF